MNDLLYYQPLADLLESDATYLASAPAFVENPLICTHLHSSALIWGASFKWRHALRPRPGYRRELLRDSRCRRTQQRRHGFQNHPRWYADDPVQLLFRAELRRWQLPLRPARLGAQPRICRRHRHQPGRKSLRRPLEQRRTSGGKARNTAFPNAAMFSQTIIIAHSSVMPNWPRPPVQERSVGTSGDPTEAACLPGRVGRRIRHYVAQITRVASSAIARSCESEIPCLSSAGPPLLQRSASGRDAWPNRSIIVQ